MSVRDAVRAALLLHPAEDWLDPVEDYARVYLKDQGLGGKDVRSAVRGIEQMLDRTEDPDERTEEILTEALDRYLQYTVEIDIADEGTTKTWVAMDDENVRASHREANGQTVGIRESFTVGGQSMFAPHDVSADATEWVNCRCTLRIGSNVTASAAGSIETDTTALEGETMEDDITDDVTDDIGDDQGDPDEPVPFHGVAVVEGVRTGDMRKFAPNSLTWLDGGMDFAWCKVDNAGHDGAVVVGRIHEMWRKGSEVRFQGLFSNSTEAEELIGFMAEGSYRGVSVDVDDSFEAVFETLDGTELAADDITDEPVVTVFTNGRIRGLTDVRIQAFPEAWVSLGPWPQEQTEPVADEDLVASAAVLDATIEHDDAEELEHLTAAAFAPGTQDGPGWLTHPIDTDRLRDYWVRGPGAAKIGWGMPGDWRRCKALLAKYVKPQHLAGYCANRHKDALGFWPGEHHRGGTEPGTSVNIVASGRPDILPGEWFEDPKLTGPSPIVVTEDGRVYGHAAQWGVCHIGIPNACVTAPQSRTNYAWFRTGYQPTTKGDIPVGRITQGTGHPGLDASLAETLAHYDNTGTVVAWVASGEDAYGIWVAGATRRGITPEEVETLRGSVLSGDWRGIRGSSEMVAVLAVNVGGFPIPRLALAASGGHQTALVAAGIVPNTTPLPPRSVEEIVSEAVKQTFETIEARERMRTMKAQWGKQAAAELRSLELQTIKEERHGLRVR